MLFNLNNMAYGIHTNIQKMEDFIETFANYYRTGNMKTSKMKNLDDAMTFFQTVLNKSRKKLYPNDNVYYFRGKLCYIIHNTKTNTFYLSIPYVWEVFENRFKYSTEEITELATYMIKKHFLLKEVVILPCPLDISEKAEAHYIGGAQKNQANSPIDKYTDYSDIEIQQFLKRLNSCEKGSDTYFFILGDIIDTSINNNKRIKFLEPYKTDVLVLVDKLEKELYC